MFSRQQETMRLLADYLCPADWRIDHFLRDYLYDTGLAIKWPSRTFILDSPGLARELSLPPDRDEFLSDLVRSYRLRQGVLHNPVNDRRTTQGVFHVAEGGLPIPDDKIAVPKVVFGRLLDVALRPPAELLRLPFTSSQAAQAECFVSLLLRPVVCPAVPGYIAEKSMEIRFFAPGSLVCNLDFIESIFGNAGDPFLPENDAGLDTEHWTGHSGCVILAPHLVKLSKKSLGLPHWDQATERQRRDGMCWKGEQELYNNGAAFKVTARAARGVILTVIPDGDRRQLLRLLQKGGQDSDQLRGQSLRPLRGGTRRRRAGLRELRFGRGILFGQACALSRPFLRGSPTTGRRGHGVAAGRPCD
jgi:hypothetical protein